MNMMLEKTTDINGTRNSFPAVQCLNLTHQEKSNKAKQGQSLPKKNPEQYKIFLGKSKGIEGQS